MTQPQLTQLTMVDGDTMPQLRFTYRDVDVTGYSFVLHAKRKDGSILTRPGTITDAATGKLTFAWQPGDILLTDPGAAQETQPFEIRITDASGGTWTLTGFALRVLRRIK